MRHASPIIARHRAALLHTAHLSRALIYQAAELPRVTGQTCQLEMLHSVCKVLATLSPMLGLVFLAAAFDVIEMPPFIAKTPDGIDKVQWMVTEANAMTGLAISPKQAMLFLGVCKFAVAFDVWVTRLVPRLALFCYAVMMGLVIYAHTLMGDDPKTPIGPLVFALLAIATWPKGKAGGAGSAKAAPAKAKKRSPKAN